MATKQEWAAMNSINPHFDFRERTAFLVGRRLALRAVEDLLRAEAADSFEGDGSRQLFEWAADRVALLREGK